MIRRIIVSLFITGALWVTGCVKETYNMDMLSKKAHLSPTLAISAVKGDVAFSDIVESSDTVVFGSDNFVTLVFRRDSVIDLKPSDFTQAKGSVGLIDAGRAVKSISDQGMEPANAYLGSWIATIDPDTIDLGIADILKKFSGDILIADPSMKLTYTNSFVDPMLVDFHAQGVREASRIDLDLAPFSLDHPADTLAAPVTSEYTINKSNSLIQNIVSMPPELISFSGTSTMSVTTENRHNDLSTNRKFIGSIEVDIPLQLKIHNLQFADTSDNFLADAFKDDEHLNWSDFKLFRIDFDVKNGFPFGISLEMNLVDSLSHTVISTVGADDVLAPATIDAGGKSATAIESKTSLTFTEDFFNCINKSDKIIFRFTMNSTGNGASDVKIYSDYRLDFKASLVVQPDFKFDF